MMDSWLRGGKPTLGHRPIVSVTIGMLLLTIASVACVTSAKQFRRAQHEDTIAAYLEFVSKYPGSEYEDQINHRVGELLIMQQEVEKEHRGRIAKVREYTIGTLTEGRFLEDGWNALDPFYGKLGIVEYSRQGQQTSFVLGTEASGGPIKPSESIGPPLAQRRFEDFISGQTDYTARSWSAHQICTLVFEQGILESVKWSK